MQVHIWQERVEGYASDIPALESKLDAHLSTMRNDVKQALTLSAANICEQAVKATDSQMAKVAETLHHKIKGATPAPQFGCCHIVP